MEHWSTYINIKFASSGRLRLVSLQLLLKMNSTTFECGGRFVRCFGKFSSDLQFHFLEVHVLGFCFTTFGHLVLSGSMFTILYEMISLSTKKAGL